jgi:hypothetical protein
VQCREPFVVEVPDHLAHIVFRDLHQPADQRHRLSLRGCQHHDRAPHPHRLLARAGDLLQFAAFLRGHRPDEHFWLTSHDTTSTSSITAGGADQRGAWEGDVDAGWGVFTQRQRSGRASNSSIAANKQPMVARWRVVD